MLPMTRVATWGMSHRYRPPKRPLAQAKRNMAIICQTYPPIGITLIWVMPNRLAPEAVFSALSMSETGIAHTDGVSFRPVSLAVLVFRRALTPGVRVLSKAERRECGRVEPQDGGGGDLLAGGPGERDL